ASPRPRAGRGPCRCRCRAPRRECYYDFVVEPTVNRLLLRAYHRLGERYLERAVFAQQQLVYPILVGAVALLSLYVDMSLGEFVRLALVGCGLQLAYSVLTFRLTRRLARPVAGWLRGSRTEEPTVAAWRAAASLPRDLLLRGLFSGPPALVLWSFFLTWCFYLAWELDLGITSALLVYLAVIVLVSYGGALRFFAAERIVRPVLEDLAATLPGGAPSGVRGIPLHGRLLAALPAI